MRYAMRKRLVAILIMFGPSLAFNAWALARGWERDFSGRGISLFAVLHVGMFALSTLAYATAIGVALMILPILLGILASLVVLVARLFIALLDLPMRGLVWLETPNASRLRPRFEFRTEAEERSEQQPYHP